MALLSINEKSYLKNKMQTNLQRKFAEDNFKAYKAYRNALNRALQSAKQNYYQALLSSNQNSPDRLWKVLNELVGSNKSERVLPSKLIVDGNEISDFQTIAETFNNCFANIGKTMGSSNAPVRREIVKTKWCNNSFFLEPSTSAEVEAIINELSNKKSKRHDDIETKFTKYSKTIISPSLSDLFNLCVSVGVFPQYLKIAEVIPIFKKGDKNKTTNYRPISLLSQLDKVFEKMIYSIISTFLEKYNLLSETQFGFGKNFSTIHAVSHIYENLLENVHHDRYSCCLFLDLSKAFDTVDHEILLHKLERLFGMRGTVLSLMQSYLTNRYQYSKILNTMSSYESISCGIRQRIMLRPTPVSNVYK